MSEKPVDSLRDWYNVARLAVWLFPGRAESARWSLVP
jgi:hypothetical protein